MGFVASWKLATLPELAYRTTALNGRFEIGDLGARILGIGWLVGAVVFIVAAWGTWRSAPWALRGAALDSAVSLVICVLGLPDSYRGAAIDVAILLGAALLVTGRFVRQGSPAR
jgi:hypothetical protein